MQTDFVLNMFRRRINRIDDHDWLDTSVLQLEMVPIEVRHRLVEAGVTTRAALLNLPTRGLQEFLGDDVDARVVYLNAWDIPGASIDRTPPRV